ncbi:MAG: hypothetical protein SV487_11535, partial [Thermodesulfobacteriota bacterium]|nr:hypothetical protein [Thermodesulfobacteriota bacterium]
MTFFPPGLMLVLPSSLAAAEARERLLSDSPDKVIIDPRIYIFRHLESELAGGIKQRLPLISDLGREMVFEKIIEDQRRRAGWPPGDGRAGPGLRRQVMDQADRLKSAGVDSFGLAESCQGLSPPEKLDFLVGVYRSFEDFLLKRGLTDRAGQRRAIIDGLKAGVSFQVLAEVKEILFQGFSRMTRFQLELTKALASAVARVEVRLESPAWITELGLDQDGGWQENPFQESLFLIKSLESLGEESQGLELIFESGEKDESGSPALAWLREGLFRPETPKGPVPDPGGQVEII